jgi:hypothetical protein
MCPSSHISPSPFLTSWSGREDLAMTLTIFDPLTGKHVTITRPERPRSPSTTPCLV